MRSFPLLILLLALSGVCFSQQYPAQIRGYKVHTQKIVVRTPSDKPVVKGDAVVVALAEPEVEDVSFSGVTFSVRATATGIDQAGTVDLLSFKDIRVNGIAADVAEYVQQTPIKKGQAVSLSEPIKATIGLGGIAKAAYRELTDAKKKWRLTGTVFVFGRFKKLGFTFKRVVPVSIDLMIDNPLGGNS